MPDISAIRADSQADTLEALCLEDIRLGDFVVFEVQPTHSELFAASLFRPEFSTVPHAMAMQPGKKGDIITVGVRGHVEITGGFVKVGDGVYMMPNPYKSKAGE